MAALTVAVRLGQQLVLLTLGDCVWCGSIFLAHSVVSVGCVRVFVLELQYGFNLYFVFYAGVRLRIGRRFFVGWGLLAPSCWRSAASVCFFGGQSSRGVPRAPPLALLVPVGLFCCEIIPIWRLVPRCWRSYRDWFRRSGHGFPIKRQLTIVKTADWNSSLRTMQTTSLRAGGLPGFRQLRLVAICTPVLLTLVCRASYNNPRAVNRPLLKPAYCRSYAF